MLSQHQMGLAISTILLLAPISVGCKGAGNDTDAAYSVSQPYNAPPQATVYAATAQPAASATGTNRYVNRLPEPNQTIQQVCPITGAKLGSMGSPVPVVVDGHTIYVCCAGCVEKLNQNPEKYLPTSQRSLSVGGNEKQFGDLPGNVNSARSGNEPRACNGSTCCH